MLFSALAFSAMAAVIKLMSAHYGAFEIVFWRGVTAIVLLTALARWQGWNLFAGPLRLHASRSIIGTSSMFCWFYALGALPLGTAMTLNYTSPLFMAALIALGLWWRGKHPSTQGWLYAAIIGGFIGVTLILRPTGSISGTELPTLVGLVSGLLSALAYFQVRSLGRIGEPVWRIVFWFSVVNALMGGVAATLTSGWHPLAIADLGWLLAIGLLALAGQLSMTRAFGRGRTLLTANLQYSGVVFAALIGWLFFAERLDALELAGIALIAISSALATMVSGREREPQASPNAAARPDPIVQFEPAAETKPASEIPR